MTKSTTRLRAARKQRTVRRIVSAGALALLASGMACKAKPDARPVVAAEAPDTAAAEPEAVPDTAPVAAAPVAAAPVETSRPTCDLYTIRESGIATAEIGDTQDAFRTRCNVLGDSTAADGDNGVRGNVVVGVNGIPMVVQIAEGRVYRITVADSAFRTPDGLGPGIPVAGLLDQPGAVVLEGAHDLSVVVGAHCGLYFRISKPAVMPESGRWSDIVRAMPQGTPVERVVVHGCRGPSAL